MYVCVRNGIVYMCVYGSVFTTLVSEHVPKPATAALTVLEELSDPAFQTIFL
jgi:hypothetical protein